MTHWIIGLSCAVFIFRRYWWHADWLDTLVLNIFSGGTGDMLIDWTYLFWIYFQEVLVTRWLIGLTCSVNIFRRYWWHADWFDTLVLNIFSGDTCNTADWLDTLVLNIFSGGTGDMLIDWTHLFWIYFQEVLVTRWLIGLTCSVYIFRRYWIDWTHLFWIYFQEVLVTRWLIGLTCSVYIFRRYWWHADWLDLLVLNIFSGDTCDMADWFDTLVLYIFSGGNWLDSLVLNIFSGDACDTADWLDTLVLYIISGESCNTADWLDTLVLYIISGESCNTADWLDTLVLYIFSGGTGDTLIDWTHLFCIYFQEVLVTRWLIGLTCSVYIFRRYWWHSDWLDILVLYIFSGGTGDTLIDWTHLFCIYFQEVLVTLWLIGHSCSVYIFRRYLWHDWLIGHKMLMIHCVPMPQEF